MTIAHRISAVLNERQFAAVTILGGYAVTYQGDRVCFVPGRLEEEKRNDKGRCTYVECRYSDGSRLKFYTPIDGPYHAVAVPPPPEPAGPPKASEPAAEQGGKTG